MIRTLFFIVFAFSCLSWKLDHNRHNCIKEKLTELAVPLIYNSQTRVYSLNYSKIDFPLDHKRIRDSFYNNYLILMDSNGIKHYHYIDKLQSLLRNVHNYTINDFRLYFGRESDSSKIYNHSVDLNYNFNSKSYKDCYNEKSEFGPFETCSSLVFRFGKNGRLIKVITDGFWY
ncbi:MAG: hypothetical protein ABIO44_04125 [Saprospiraceae bacterium]